MAKAKEASANARPSAPPEDHRCSKCMRGPSDVVFKWRSDVCKGGWRSECNSCINMKNYSASYRARERSKDEKAYLKRNAETHLAWAHRNREKVVHQQEFTVQMPDRRIKQIRTSAKARGVEFVRAEMDVMAAKLTTPCFYCMYAPTDGDKLNGLDRVDPTLPYNDANTVPCCGCCNGMKNAMCIDEFVNLVRRICHHQGIEPLQSIVGSKRERSLCMGGTTEACSKTKEKRMLLDNEQQLTLKCAPCYLCGVSFSCGIDRVDSDGDYTIDNVRPCCSPCNFMKKHLALDEFKKHLQYVLTHTATWVLKDVSNMSTIIGKNRQPISVLDDSGKIIIVFPSILYAARMLHVDHKALLRAMANNTRYGGYYWVRSEVKKYNQQVVSYEYAKKFMKIFDTALHKK